MMIGNSVSAAVLFLALLMMPGMAFAMGSDLQIRAGLARKRPDGAFVIYKHTTNVPFVSQTANPNYYFGVAASAASGEDLKCHVVLYLPQQNAIHGEGGADVGDELIASVPYHRIRLADVDVPVCQMYMSLDDGDAPGHYIVEMFIGGKMAQRVVFNVRR